EILRRVQDHGVTLLCGAPAVVNAVLDAAQVWDGGMPGAGRTRIIGAGAPPPTRTIERVETELGWEFIQIYGLTETSPLLTMNRGREEWDADTPAERAPRFGRAGGARARGPSARTCSAVRARPRSACDCRSATRAKCWPGRTSCWRATGTTPRRRAR